MAAMYQVIAVLIFISVSQVHSVPGEPDPYQALVKDATSVNQTAQLAKSPKNGTEAGLWGRRMGGNFFTLKPEMLQTFYVFLGISFLLMFFIIFRIYRCGLRIYIPSSNDRLCGL